MSPSVISGNNSSGAGFMVTNTLVGDISVRKNWIGDEDYKADTRLESVKVWLTADGEDVDSAELTAAGNWQATFADRPLYKIIIDGTELKSVQIDYNVREEPVPGYIAGTPARDPEGSNHFVIPNTLVVTDIEVQKTWPSDPSGLSMTVVLLSYWAEAGQMQEVARKDLPVTPAPLSADPWTAVFNDMPVWKGDRKIKYEVAEANRPAGYVSPQIIQISEYRFIIRNRLESLVDVMVVKTWEG